MATEVGTALARLSRRDDHAGEEDLLFVGLEGGDLDASALLQRYRAALRSAGLRPLRFHDLRHTFGTRVIAEAEVRRVQEWIGHADVQTTMRYPHYAPWHDDAVLVARATGVGARRRRARVGG
jgi:integrase